MTRSPIAALFLVLLLLAPAAASAQAPTNAPPGNSAIDEYLETVPGATGDARPRPPGAPGGDAGLTPSQREDLQRRGPDGALLVALADSIASGDATRSRPTAGDRDDAASPAGERSAREDAVAAQGRSPLSATLAAATGGGDGGMGLLLPILLVAGLAGFVALAIARRRAAG